LLIRRSEMGEWVRLPHSPPEIFNKEKYETKQDF